MGFNKFTRYKEQQCYLMRAPYYVIQSVPMYVFRRHLALFRTFTQKFPVGPRERKTTKTVCFLLFIIQHKNAQRCYIIIIVYALRPEILNYIFRKLRDFPRIRAASKLYTRCPANEIRRSRVSTVRFQKPNLT